MKNSLFAVVVNLFNALKRHIVDSMIREIEVMGNRQFLAAISFVLFNVRASVVESDVQGGLSLANVLHLAAVTSDEVDQPIRLVIDVAGDGVICSSDGTVKVCALANK